MRTRFTVITAPPAEKSFVVESGPCVTKRSGPSGTPWYAEVEGWQPNVEVQHRNGHWRKAHVHMEWDRKRTDAFRLPPEYVVSYRSGGLATTTTRPIRPLTPL